MSVQRCFISTRLARRRIAAGIPIGRVPTKLPSSSRFSMPRRLRSPQILVADS